MHSPTIDPTADDLITLELAIGPGKQRERVLAHVVLKTPFSAEVVFSDTHGEFVSRSIPCINHELPGHYKAQGLGKMADYLDQNPDALDRILLADTSRILGRLTLARSIFLMANDHIDARAAIDSANDIAARCKRFNDDVQTSMAAMYQKKA